MLLILLLNPGFLTINACSIARASPRVTAEVVIYLLVEDVTRRPFRQSHDELGTRLADLDMLSDADRAALLHILDGLLANTRIRQALHNAG